MVKIMTDREYKGYKDVEKLAQDINNAVFKLKIEVVKELNTEEPKITIDKDAKIMERRMLEEMEREINKVLEKYQDVKKYTDKYNKQAEKYSRILYDKNHRIW